MTPSILIIYTGGTIGMQLNHTTGTLSPLNFEQIETEMPELQKFNLQIDTHSFDPPIDSSEVQPAFWVRLARMIYTHYTHYDGFVVLHGTDTMSYTASAISFMLENLAKPVVFTGSQLPVGLLRTDGKENLISAIEIAAAVADGRPCVPEVSILFNNQLYRANRTTKYNAEQFRAFRSANYPPLAEIGVHIKYNPLFIRQPERPNTPLLLSDTPDTNIAILKLFPGIGRRVVEGILSIEGLRAIVLETYGSGNAPTVEWFINALREAIRRGLIILNVSQCHGGTVEMDHYQTGILLKKIGVVSGYDSTTEAAVAKLAVLLGQTKDIATIIAALHTSLRGEISPETNKFGNYS
ncbi:MAG: asparaginase [Prevotellaceae bacterium]|jgi:L-asparaginase|nr:asparaginase [Prevotellaceae bacterium]